MKKICRNLGLYWEVRLQDSKCCSESPPGPAGSQLDGELQLFVFGDSVLLFGLNLMDLVDQ